MEEYKLPFHMFDFCSAVHIGSQLPSSRSKEVVQCRIKEFTEGSL